MTVIAPVRGPADWRGGELAGRRDWRLALSHAHKAELLAALAAATVTGLRLADISPGRFPLPSLGPLLDRLAGELIDGRGVAVIQGVPVGGLSERECEILSLGIGRYIGTAIAPEASPVHVRDDAAVPGGPAVPAARPAQRLDYHTDPTDIVALLCVRPAKSGGLTSIVSSVAVHNELVAIRPDLAEALYQPWGRRSRRGPGSAAGPVYTVSNGRMFARYGPDQRSAVQRGAVRPALSPLQQEALEVLEELNNDPRFVLNVDFRAGDMHFLNSYVTMHSRTGFEDYAEPGRRRDLIRLWLSTDRELPPPLGRRSRLRAAGPR